MRKRRTKREHDRLRVRAARADHERRHDALGVPRLQAMQRAQGQRRRQKPKRMRAGVLREVQWIHRFKLGVYASKTNPVAEC
jgi:hypothetical protein